MPPLILGLLMVGDKISAQSLMKNFASNRENVPKWCWIAIPFIGLALVTGFLTSCSYQPTVCKTCWSVERNHVLYLYDGKHLDGYIDLNGL